MIYALAGLGLAVFLIVGPGLVAYGIRQTRIHDRMRRSKRD